MLLELYAKNSGQPLESHYHDALDVYSKAIRSDSCEEYLRARAYLFIKTGQLDSALNDFNAITNRWTIPAYKMFERSLFKIFFLKDYSDAAKDLERYIDEHVPDNPLTFHYDSEYSELFFLLGVCRYNLKQYALAFTAWRQTSELREDGSTTAHFDLMIRKHPKVSSLYLGRAIAHYKIGRYRDNRQEHHEKALYDLRQAEMLGSQDYRINLYRANVFEEMGLRSKALVELRKAILKNDQDPRCFELRYRIGREMGTAEVHNEDEETAIELAATWKFQ